MNLARARLAAPPAASRTGLLFAIAWSSFACGYRFTLRGSGEPVFVSVFENGTTEAGAGVLVAEALRRELAVRGIEGGEAAPRRVGGEVVSVDFRPGALAQGGGPATYVVSLTLRVRGSGPNGAFDKTVNGSEEYLPENADPDPQQWEASRRAALTRLAEKLARPLAGELAAGR